MSSLVRFLKQRRNWMLVILLALRLICRRFGFGAKVLSFRDSMRLLDRSRVERLGNWAKGGPAELEKILEPMLRPGMVKIWIWVRWRVWIFGRRKIS